jgi:hypothetical protein
MHDIQQQLVGRNNRETAPFVLVYEAYSSLLNQIDALQFKVLWSRARGFIASATVTGSL